MIKRTAIWVVAAALLMARSGLAQETSPQSLEDVKLLADVPDYASALVNQWSGNDVPAGFETAETDVDHYGRLRETVPLEAVTLPDCVSLALSHNTDLQIQRLGPLSARAAVRSAQSIFDPTVFGDTSYDRSVRISSSFLAPTSGTVDPTIAGTLALLGPPTSVAHNLNVDGGVRKTLLSGGQLAFTWRNNRLTSNSSFIALRPQYSTDFALSLNQPLLRDFGLRFSTLLVRVAKNTQRQSVYQYEATIATIVKQVEATYWTVVLANENVSVQQQGLAAAKELQRQNEGKFKVGALPQTAVLEAQAEVARREANLIQAENAQIIARDNLRALINFRRDGTDALVMVEAGDVPSVVVGDFDLDRSLETAMEKRPELQVAKLDVHGKGMLLKVAENQLLPRLNAVGAIGTNGLSGGRTVVTRKLTDANGNPIIDPDTGQQKVQTFVNPFNGPYDEALNKAVDGRFYAYSAGVTLEIPLDNAQAKASYAQSRIDLEASKRTLEKQQETVTLEVKTAVTNLQSDLKSVDATRIARELAEENLRNQKARYDVGLATTKDLLDFLDRLTQAKFLEIQALTTYNTDLAELRRAEGTLLAARNIIVDHGEEEPTPWWAQF